MEWNRVPGPLGVSAVSRCIDDNGRSSVSGEPILERHGRIVLTECSRRATQWPVHDDVIVCCLACPVQTLREISRLLASAVDTEKTVDDGFISSSFQGQPDRGSFASMPTTAMKMSSAGE